MTPGRKNLFALAERLGMTVHDLQARLPIHEYFEWIEYLSPKEKEQSSAPEILSAFGLK